MDLFVGINGCSLRTEESLEIAKKIPLDRLMIETDSPYCEIKNTHPSKKYVKTVFDPAKDKKKHSKELMVKGRNEPCKTIQVAEVLAEIKGVSVEELSKIVYENSCKVFARTN